MLLQLWAQHLKDFRGESKNVIIYRQMAREMSQFGPSHTELKTKMDNLSRKYRCALIFCIPKVFIFIVY